LTPAGAERTDSAIGSNIGLTGYTHDPETGLCYARARMFSPELGRFINRDPAGYVDGYGLYTAYFVPNAVDPEGKFYHYILAGLISAAFNAVYQYTDNGYIDPWEVAASGAIGMLGYGVIARWGLVSIPGAAVVSVGVGGASAALYENLNSGNTNYNTAILDASVLAPFAAMGISRFASHALSLLSKNSAQAGEILVAGAINGRSTITRNTSLPIFAQPDNKTCAPTSVSMALETIEPSRLSTQLGSMVGKVKARAVTLNDVESMLRANGVNASRVNSMSVTQLEMATSGKNPAIVGVWIEPTQGHAVVVDGITIRNGIKVVAIRDPWEGRSYFLKLHDFVSIWIGNSAVVIK
jgi:RHS repeat-associated protein